MNTAKHKYRIQQDIWGKIFHILLMKNIKNPCVIGHNIDFNP